MMRPVPLSQSSKPVTPAEIAALVRETLPPFVFETFNKLIEEAWDGREAVVTVNAATAALELARNDRDFDPIWLRIDQAYRDAGWVVLYAPKQVSMERDFAVRPACFCFRLPSQK
jgi:hypothetical protein